MKYGLKNTKVISAKVDIWFCGSRENLQTYSFDGTFLLDLKGLVYMLAKNREYFREKPSMAGTHSGRDRYQKQLLGKDLTFPTKIYIYAEDQEESMVIMALSLFFLFAIWNEA